MTVKCTSTPSPTNFGHIAFLAILLTCGALAGPTIATPAGEPRNIVVNGDFAQLDNGWVRGWSRGDPRHITVREEAGKRFVRFQLGSEGAAMISQRVRLEPSWQSLDITLRVRARDLKRGGDGWMTGRLEYLFYNAQGERVGGWPWLGLEQDGSTDGWVTLRREGIRPPPGATELNLALGLWVATGTFDVAELVVTPRVHPGLIALQIDPHQEHMLSNIDWSHPDEQTGLPAGWLVNGDASAMTIVQGGDGQRVLRIERNSAGDAYLSQRVPVHPWWTHVNIGVQIKTGQDFSVSEGGPHGANLRYRFFDADGREMERNHFGAQRAEASWRHHRHDNKRVPTGAVELEVMVGLFQSRGLAEFRGVHAIPTVTERKPGTVPDELVGAWRESKVEKVTATRQRMSLDGEWQFMPGRGPASLEPTADGWGFIRVPGSWHDDVVASGITEPWHMFNPRQTNKAWYQRRFIVPADWRGQRIELDFERVSTDATVWVNGREVGRIHWPFGTLDITDAVTPGEEAEILVAVIAMDDRDEVVHYMGYVDEPRRPAQLDHRGILGRVVLQSRPVGGRVYDLLLRPSVREGKLYIDVELADIAQAGRIVFTAEMLDDKGDVERTFEQAVDVQPASMQVVTLVFDWNNARLWDYKQPNLYMLRLTLGGLIEDQYLQRFGFREFWIEGRQFFLNGTEIRLRPGNIQYGARPQHIMDRGLNFGHHWPEDQFRRGTRSDLNLDHYDEADRIGLLTSANVAHMRWHTDRWDNPATREEYLHFIERQVRLYRNHPSIVMYTHSANAFQWQGDGNPEFIGMTGFSAMQEYYSSHLRAMKAIDAVKAIDPKPVYAHFGTYFGDVYTSNMYLNFIPLQEREEWLSHWVEKGELPFMAVEMGPPLYSSVMRGRDGYTHQGYSEPFPTEWAAVYFGRDAYEWESAELRDLLHERYRGDNIQQEYHPHIRHGAKERMIQDRTGLRQVLDVFFTNTWRSWRTMGMSGGLIAWHHDNLDSLRRVNGNSLAWIAGEGGVPSRQVDGQPAFTEKTHHYRTGDTLRKQFVLINDFRHPALFTGSYEVTIGGSTVAEGEITGELATSQMRFMPLEVKLPGTITGQRQRGAITFRATIHDEKHEHTFTFDVFAPRSPARGVLSVFDPKGSTTAYLESLGYTVEPWLQGQPRQPVAVVGRHALTHGQTIPGDVAAFVRDGGRLLVMAQDPLWMKYALHLRTAPHLSRRVFQIDPHHPVVAHLDNDNLRDWNGASTLVDGYRNFPGFEWVPHYGWRWGNRHAVSSAPIEKPHRGGWRPILESEFDSAYTPLMEMDYGRGRIIMCTLDLEGRTIPDPAADLLATQLIQYLSGATIPPRAGHVTYMGDAQGLQTLDLLGVRYAVGHVLAGDLVIIGPGAEIAEEALRRYVNAGGKVLVLRHEAGKLPLGVQVATRKGFYGSTDPPTFAEAVGLSPSDLRWRGYWDAALLEEADDVLIAAGGQLGRMALGEGVVIFAQIGPDAVPADERRYFRFTRWRQTRALSQVLANLGATFEQDDRFIALLSKPDHYINLAGEWEVAGVNPLPESPTREWHAYQPISEVAMRLIKPEASGDWKRVLVPSYLEAYGPDWKWLDGEFVFRRTIHWPEHAVGRRAFLSLGRVDENETTFVNGDRIGSSRHWLFPRGHFIEAGMLRAGENTIAIRVWDEGIHGGMAGSWNQIYITVEEDNPGFYHPDYITDDVSRGTQEADWQRRVEQQRIADEPYRYYRW